MASLTTSSLIAFNTDAASVSMAVNLSSGIALTADIINEVVSGKASASSDYGVPNFISLARFVANTISSIINFSWRAKTAAVSNEIVSLSANAFSINISFIGVA